MKKPICALLTFFLVISMVVINTNANAQAAAPTLNWEESNPSIDIYSKMQTNDKYEIYYNNIPAEQVKISEVVHLLMINGGYVPNPEIIIQNGRTMAPVRVISEVLGAKVEWDSTNKTVAVTSADQKIILTIGNNLAVVNGKENTLDSPAFINNSKTYVPLRFLSSALGFDVQYIPDITFGQSVLTPFYVFFAKQISIVSIEKVSKDVKIFTTDEGLAAVKKLSALTYKDGYRDNDMQDITYSKTNLGRYYVYILKGYESCPIFFNMYTGDIFSSQQSVPMFSIHKGFIVLPNN